MKTIVFLWFSLLSITVAHGQSTTQIQQLKTELQDCEDRRRIEILKTLAEYYRDTLLNEAIGYATQYLNLTKLYDLKTDEATAYQTLANIYFYQVDYRNALINNKKACQVFHQLHDTLKVANCQTSISTNYLYLYIYDSATMYNDSARSIYSRYKKQVEMQGADIQKGKVFNLSFQNDSAIIILNQVLQYPDLSLAYKSWASYWLGNSYFKMGDFTNAEKILFNSVEWYNQQNDVFGKLGSYQLLGNIYLVKGQYANAYNLFFLSYQNRRSVKGKIGRENFKGQYFINMGNVFCNTGNYETTLQYYDSALKIGVKYQLKSIQAKAIEYIGTTFLQQNLYDKALEKFELALEINQSEKYLLGEATILSRIGTVYFQQNKIEKAIAYFTNALAISNKIGNDFEKASSLLQLARCHIKLGKYQVAKKILDDGFPLAMQTEVDELVKSFYLNYIQICEATGRHNISHQYLNLFLELSEKINQSNLKNLTDLLIKYYENGIENEKKMFTSEMEIKNLETEKNRLHLRQLIYISIIVIGVAIILILLYINKFLSARKLERIVAERTKTIRENEQKLIESVKTQDKLYSIIAHDLKSPFNSLLGFANLLHEEYDEILDDERKKYIDIMRSSSEEIFFLLENLLEWTRNSLEDIHYKPVRFDLTRVLKQSISLVEKNATIKNISIKNQIPKNTFVFADENMVRTIFRNLLSNAIKFTHAEGEIIINSQQMNDFIGCSVEDNGVGISQENIAKLFKMDGTIRKKGTANERGTGLGLALCKEFVEKNGGSISVESEPEKGSKFVFTLPVK